MSSLPRALVSVALAAMAVGAAIAEPASAQECPAGQQPMCFPAESYFVFWRYSTASINAAREEVWHSESRQRRRERLPLGGGSLNEYFDLAAGTLTLVQYAGSTIVDCSQFEISQTPGRPCVTGGCYSFVEEANVGGFLPVERWWIREGATVNQDVFAQRVGDDLVPLWLYNRQSATIYTSYVDYRGDLDDADLELPCEPVVIPTAAGTALLRSLETEHGLAPGGLGGSEVAE